MTELNKITFVCKAFSGQLRDQFEQVMGKNLDTSKQEDCFNHDFLDFFNKFHELNPALIDTNMKWFYTTFNQFYGYEPHISWVEQAITCTKPLTSLGKNPVAKPVTKPVVTQEVEDEDDPEDDIGFGLFD